MSNQTVVILDFGGQYKELIARRVRECGVYSVIEPYDTPVEQLAAMKPIGIIFTGGPQSVYADDSPACDEKVFRLGVPILGICYGMQLMCHMCGGRVISCLQSEYGTLDATLDVTDSALFAGLESDQRVLMSHTDRVDALPEGFRVTAHTALCPVAAFENNERRLYGVQFHPEVTHTVYGKQMLHNFIFLVCGCKADWKIENFVETSVERYKKALAGKKVLLALSGGVDSSVAAVLLHKAIGNHLTCVFVDHGLLRKGEGDFVENTFGKQFGINLIRVNAEDRFLVKLKGVTEPEQKRKIIGEEFIRVFEDVAKKLGEMDVFVQGTIYPDVIESGKGDSAVIKSHHNVGGLPDVIAFDEIVEPLRDLFKDEVRETGTQLGIPHELVWRQPFPGPGLAVRVIGEVTKEKLDLLREADAIFREEIAGARLESSVSQYFAVLTDLRSVGVMGDARTYGYTVALRAVTTDDFMTAEWTRLPYEVLEKASSRITNEIKGITRVVYDITSKPPATVEWE